MEDDRDDAIYMEEVARKMRLIGVLQVIPAILWFLVSCFVLVMQIIEWPTDFEGWDAEVLFLIGFTLVAVVGSGCGLVSSIFFIKFQEGDSERKWRGINRGLLLNAVAWVCYAITILGLVFFGKMFLY